MQFGVHAGNPAASQTAGPPGVCLAPARSEPFGDLCRVDRYAGAPCFLVAPQVEDKPDITSSNSRGPA